MPDAPLNETTPAPMSAPVFDWPSTHEQPQIADQTPPPPPTPPPSERAAAVPPRGPGRPPQQGGRSRLLIALGLVGVIVVAAAAFLLTRGDSSDTSTPAPAVVATKLPEGLAWQPISDVPFRRQYAAATAVDGKVWMFGGIGVQDVEHHDEVLRPGDQRVVDGARPARAPAPLLGRDLQGRGRRDRRLHAGGRT